MAILAVIAGAKGWEDIENYASVARSVWRGVLATEWYPGHDTFRVFERLNPQVLSAAFNAGWSPGQELGAQVIPIDGKTLKGSYEKKKRSACM